MTIMKIMWNIVCFCLIGYRIMGFHASHPKFVAVRLEMASPNFKFGVIADIQYADSDDNWNFQQTSMRRYRNSLDIYRNAVKRWDKEQKVDFSLVLGDLVDGRASAQGNQHIALQSLQHTSNQMRGPVYYCFGNHCHYCFSRAELRSLIGQSFLKERRLGGAQGIDVWSFMSSSPEVFKGLNYTWKARPGWRFVSLDGYDVSLIGSSTECRRTLAEDLLSYHNPNDLAVSGGWFKGLSEDKLRYVPYNGGISTSQLAWLNETLYKSHQRKEKVVIFCHQPVFSPDRPKSLVWNAEEVLSVLHQYPGTVVLWLAGHDHEGQSAVDSQGIHHLVPPAPIECELGDTSFGTFEVYDKHLQFLWYGSKPSFSWHPWPDKIYLS